jgi:hypothetical protein
VLDENGKPIERASVVVKGTKIGTRTEENGIVKLTVPPTAKDLIITALNFERREVYIEGENEVEIKINPLDSKLDEVVVVAYGTQKKNTVTGSGD